MQRRGMTLIEVVVSIIIMAVLSATILSATSYMQRAVKAHEHKLNAAEVAHRIIAQKLDNAELVPDDSLPIQQGDSLYAFKLIEEVVLVGGDDDAELESMRSDEANTEERLKNRLHQLKVHVFHVDAQTGQITSAEPLVTVVRVYNIIRTGDQDEVLNRIVRMMTDRGNRRGNDSEGER